MPNECVISKIKEFCDLLSIEDLEIVEKNIASVKNNKSVEKRRVFAEKVITAYKEYCNLGYGRGVVEGEVAYPDEACEYCASEFINEDMREIYIDGYGFLHFNVGTIDAT